MAPRRWAFGEKTGLFVELRPRRQPIISQNALLLKHCPIQK